MVRCNAIPIPTGDPSQSIPTNGVPFGSGGGGGSNNNVLSQFSPSQNPPTVFGSNSRPNYFGSSSQLMPFPTYFNQQPPPSPPQQQQFGAQPPYPYLTLYAGNNVGSNSQMLPYYGQFRPYQGGIGTYGGASMPYSSRYQNNQQFGQQPHLSALTPTLFDRMDTTKQGDEQEKKSTQQ